MVTCCLLGLRLVTADHAPGAGTRAAPGGRCRHYYRLLQVDGYWYWYSADNAESLSVRRSSKEGCKQRCLDLDIRNETDNAMRRINKEDMYATSVLISVVSPGIASIQAQQRQGSFLTDEIKTMFVGWSAGPNVPMYQCLLFTVFCGMLVAGGGLLLWSQTPVCHQQLSSLLSPAQLSTAATPSCASCGSAK